MTSSCGRLFDAVAALTGRWPEAHYEAQAAIELMALTTAPEVAAAEPLTGFVLDQLFPSLPVEGIIRGAALAVSGGAAPAEISARFHRTLLDLLTAAATLAHRQTGLTDVVLAGGVFQNEILLTGMMAALPQVGLTPWRPVRCPANDGAVALGQAAVARALK